MDTLEIELPADCFNELLPSGSGQDYFRSISDLSEVKINNSFDINHIKNVKLRGSGDYSSYIILPLRHKSISYSPDKQYALRFTDMTLYGTGGGSNIKFHNMFCKIDIYFKVNDLSIDRIQITVYNKVYQNET